MKKEITLDDLRKFCKNSVKQTMKDAEKSKKTLDNIDLDEFGKDLCKITYSVHKSYHTYFIIYDYKDPHNLNKIVAGYIGFKGFNDSGERFCLESGIEIKIGYPFDEKTPIPLIQKVGADLCVDTSKYDKGLLKIYQLGKEAPTFPEIFNGTFLLKEG